MTRLETKTLERLRNAVSGQKYILGTSNYNVLASPKYRNMFEYSEERILKYLHEGCGGHGHHDCTMCEDRDGAVDTLVFLVMNLSYMTQSQYDNFKEKFDPGAEFVRLHHFSLMING